MQNPHENDTLGEGDNILNGVDITMSFWNSTVNNYKNEVRLLNNVKLDFGIFNGMNGGVIVFVEIVDKQGDTL